MKAEKRHQLQTNYLADQMGKLWKGSQGSGSMVWGVLLLVVVVGVAYWWLSSTSANRVSATWISWWDSRRSPGTIEILPDAELTKLAEQFRGSAADQAAQLTLADQLYEKGYQTTFRESATAARQHYERAFAIYEPLSSAASTREVALRALVGAARCQESLGEVDKARAIYQQVVDRFAADLKGPDGTVHPLVADAQQRVISLARGDGLAFYSDLDGRKPWPQRLPKSEKTSLPPLGEAPPVPPPALEATPRSTDGPPPPTFPEIAPGGLPENRPEPPKP